jgi:hypothetical protein
MADGGSKSSWPTRKWWVAQATAVGALVVALIEAKWDFNSSLQIVAVGLVVEAFSTWLIPNLDTPGGVPLKNP